MSPVFRTDKRIDYSHSLSIDGHGFCSIIMVKPVLILKRKLYLKKREKYVKLESCARRTSNVCTTINQTGMCWFTLRVVRLFLFFKLTLMLIERQEQGNRYQSSVSVIQSPIHGHCLHDTLMSTENAAKFCDTFVRVFASMHGFNFALRIIFHRLANLSFIAYDLCA